MEDDLSALAPSFDTKLSDLVRTLSPSWQLVYLGFHESTGKLLGPRAKPAVVEIPPRVGVTGLFGYLLRRSAAATLLKEGAIFPLRFQVDVAVSQLPWPPGTRFAAHPEAVLLASPKSEVGKCDTDVQTLGRPTENAHARLPPTMMRM